MFNLQKFIGDSVTGRPTSMFEVDIQANKETLTREIKGKTVCVIGGAGSIGSSFIMAVLRFEPKAVVVVDLQTKEINAYTPLSVEAEKHIIGISR